MSADLRPAGREHGRRGESELAGGAAIEPRIACAAAQLAAGELAAVAKRAVEIAAARERCARPARTRSLFRFDHQLNRTWTSAMREAGFKAARRDGRRVSVPAMRHL